MDKVVVKHGLAQLEWSIKAEDQVTQALQVVESALGLPRYFEKTRGYDDTLVALRKARLELEEAKKMIELGRCNAEESLSTELELSVG